MPIHRIQGPDGNIHRIEAPDDARPEDVIAFLSSQLGAEDKPGSAFGRGLSRSVDITQQGLGSALEGIGRSTGFGGLEQYGADVAARNTKELEEAEQYATRRQDVEGVGTGLSYAGETLAESAVPMGIGIGAGIGAGALAGSVVPGIGTVAGAAIGAAGAALSQIPLFYGWNRERQKEAVQQGIIPEVSESAAFLTAIPQAALEGIADRLLIGTGRLLVKPGSGLFTGLAKGAGAGVVTEVPTEIGQQVLERAQAGLPLDDDEAMQEYTDAAVGAGLIGGGIGGVSGGISGRRGAAKQKTGEEEGETQQTTSTESTTLPGFGREEVEQRLRTAAGEDTPKGQGQALAVSRKLNNDIALGTPEKLAESAAYIKSLQDQIEAGQIPEVEIEPLRRTLAEASTILNEFQGVATTATPKTTTETPSGPEQDILGETRKPRVRGRKRGVPPAGGESVDAGVTDPATGTAGAGLGVLGESAEQVGSGKDGKPGTLKGGTTSTGLSFAPEPVPYGTSTWDPATNQAVRSTGENSVVDYSGRKMTILNIGGVRVPFYLSTGLGGKKGVAAGKWYPFFGVGADGWINKTNDAEINNYYGSQELREAAEHLDSTVGDIRQDNTTPRVGATGPHWDALNAGLTPTENGVPNAPTALRSNIDNVLARLNAARTTAKTVAEQPSAAGEALAREFPKVPPAAPAAIPENYPLTELLKGMDPALFDAFHAGALAGVDSTDIKPTVPAELSAAEKKAYTKGFTGGLTIATSKVDALKGFTDTAEPVTDPVAPAVSVMDFSPRYRPAFQRGMLEASAGKELSDQAEINKKQPGWQAAYKAGYQFGKDQRKAEDTNTAPTAAAPEVVTKAAAPEVVAEATSPVEEAIQPPAAPPPPPPPGSTAAAAAPPPPPPPPPPGSTAAAPAAPAIEMAIPKLNTIKGLVNLFTRNFNNRFATATEISNFLKKFMGVDVLPENMNLDRAFELFQTKKNAAQRMLERKFFDPIAAALKRDRVDLGDFGLYLLARAAPDRNRMVREVNAAFPEGGSGMDDAEAASYMADFKARGLLPKLERAAKMHDALVDFMGEMRVRSGILSRKAQDALRKEQPFYTPFKGFAVAGDMLTSDLQEDPHAEESRQKLLRDKRGLGMREFIKAKGRDSLPFHPLYNLFYDAETLVRRTAMNDVYTTFLRMVEANPEGMKGFIQGIYTDTQPKKTTIVDKDNPAGRTINVNMAEEVMRDRNRYHVVKDKGVTKYIEFSDSEAGLAAQRLFTNLQPEQVGQVLGAITGINNVLKAMLTYRNPIYLSIVAPLRDTLDAVATAMLNRNIKGSPAYKKKLVRKVVAYSTQVATWRTVTRYLLNREPVPGQENLTVMLEQMLTDGGAPMGIAFRTAQDRASAAIKDLDWFRRRQEGNSLAVAREGAKKLGRFFDHWAEINDLVPRFATYRAAIEEGLTGPQAASLALDSSLNLTRRGEMSMLMDNIFPFFSASVEGSRKVKRIVTNPKTMVQVVGGMIAIGMMESLANATMGGDEDDDGTPDYLDINPGKKMTHLTLYYGGGGDDYVSIPIGQMLGYFKYVGSKITDTWLGTQSGEEAGAAILSAGADVVGGLVGLLSPARVMGGDLERTLVSLTPLWGRPITDLAINQNYFGVPIYQPERDDTGPAAELGRATTGEMWKSIARGINQMTGGSPATGGYVNFQPEVYKYILQTYLGGWSRLGKQVLDFSEEPSAGKVPIVRGFLGDGFDYIPQNKYQKNTAALEKIVSRIDKLSDAQLQLEVRRNPVALDPRVISAYEDTNRTIQQLYKQRREDLRTENLSADDKKALLEYYRAEMNKLQSAFNYVYDAVEEGR
jgi:hypothetical protein